MKDLVSQCDVYLTHRDSQVQEPLLQHQVPFRRWAKVAVDICFHFGRFLLAVNDYFSNFVEVDSLYLKPRCQLLEVSWQFLADLEYQIPW